MNYAEIQGDLFSSVGRDKTLLVHCISSDFALGAGIAKQFTARGVKQELLSKYKKDGWQGHGYCLLTDNGISVANLVTKEKYWHKPTITTVHEALLDLKTQAAGKGYKNLAMPAIGCGLDRLRWQDVRIVVNDVFEDTDMNVSVYFVDKVPDDAPIANVKIPKEKLSDDVDLMGVSKLESTYHFDDFGF